MLVAGGVTTLLLTTMAGAFGPLRARQHYAAALSALGENRLSDTIAHLDRATEADPQDPFFQHRAAMTLLEQRAGADPARQNALTREAVNRLEQSLATGAHEEFAHFNLGWLKLDLGQPNDAARHFIRAARLVPDKGGVYFGLGLALHAMGQRATAIRAFALEIINDPRALTSPTWEIPLLAEMLPDLRAEVANQFKALASQVPRAAAVNAWTKWWWGEQIPPAALQPAAGPEAARFVTVLSDLEAGRPLPAAPDIAWSRVYAAWQEARRRPPPAAPEFFLPVANGDGALAAALARRTDRHRDSFRGFLTAATEDEPALIRTSRRQRSGYGVLALHPAGPPLTDAFGVQENRVASELAGALFPPKGWLPGRFLLASLPGDPR